MIQDTVDRLELNLAGLVVLTEAGSNAFAVTPAIAAVAGADRVYAITKDSSFGSVQAIQQEASRLARECRVQGSITFLGDLSASVVSTCDIVTNLGFVRPIDARTIAWMRPTAVVCLMCESWEVRSSDVDVSTCRQRGILIAGTNEHDQQCGVFAYAGVLALRLLLEAGFEVLGTRVALIGWDPFSSVIDATLRSAGAIVHCANERTATAVERTIEGVDAILVADYVANDCVIGPNGLASAETVRQLAPVASVVQFAGGIDVSTLTAAGVTVWPPVPVPPRRMALTLGALGSRPVIELHSAGLRVGEVLARLRRAGMSPESAMAEGMRRSSLVQP